MIGSVAIGNNKNLSWFLGHKEEKKIYKNLKDIKEEIVEVDSLPFVSVFIERNVIEK